MDTEPEYSEFLTYEQAAERLNCSLKTIQRLVAEGELTAHRRRGEARRLIPTTEVTELATPKPIGDEDK